MNELSKSLFLLFGNQIAADSKCGKNTYNLYKEDVNNAYSIFIDLCNEKQQLYKKLHDEVLEKFIRLDEIAESFLENSDGLAVFCSYEDAEELMHIILYDVKKSILDNAILLINTYNSFFKSSHDCFSIQQYDYNDFTPPPRESKKKRPNLPNYSKDILSSWFREHVDHPYPTQVEKAELSEKSGVSLQKVENWFINERSRKWKTYPRK